MNIFDSLNGVKSPFLFFNININYARRFTTIALWEIIPKNKLNLFSLNIKIILIVHLNRPAILYNEVIQLIGGNKL
jgi:hypothetical protein